ncbi:hypothetical protein MRBLMC3_001090 [Sphingobium sp. LMC3-1-1.1]|uniref:hypothetical protein n=1 Tax=Sphingobium sp. LMC3-1-1.1 TaxID=3135241 RepID=UPI00344850F3
MPPALEHFCKAWKAVIGLRMATALMKWMAAAAAMGDGELNRISLPNVLGQPE